MIFKKRVKCGDIKGKVVVAHGCRKTKKLICGTEGEIVVAHDPLLSPTRTTRQLFIHYMIIRERMGLGP